MGLFDKVKSAFISTETEYTKINEDNENILPELHPLPHTSVFKYNDNEINKSMHTEALKAQLECGSDYIETVANTCCSECAKYRERIYCISGKDERFPKFPEYIHRYSWHCGISCYPFEVGISSIRTQNGDSISELKDIIEYSNRLFVDDRDEEEMSRYNQLLERRKQDYIDSVNKKYADAEYNEISQKLPDIVPKSSASYLRMKKTNSANYQKIASEAKKIGILIVELMNKNNME